MGNCRSIDLCPWDFCCSWRPETFQWYSYTPLSPADFAVLVDLVNGFFDPAGISITDFGLRFQTVFDTTEGRLIIPGTPSYWPPEAKTAGPSLPGDMWAVGCMCYEICLGQKLSESNNRQAIDAVAGGGALDLSQLDQSYGQRVRYILAQCLVFQPDARWSATQMRDYLRILYEQTGFA